ncbi:MAG: ribosomal RNA small subunit methyltransferase A [Kiritimatiellae bacterium]|nr:ribosomal RNA small subunit methyltransferase A [Kiritimatiellia bacterium]
MNLTSPSQVKAWCISNGFHPNKTLGQNFLIDRNVLNAIVDAGLEKATPETDVLEIGPGLGVLTEELLARSRNVTAVEKDPVLASRLKESLGSPEALEVVADDALRYIKTLPTDKYGAMVSNLPYQAGTRILLDLAWKRSVRVMTVLVQTEVAERLAAKEGSKVRSLSGVLAQLDYDVQILRKVAANCFWPRPEIGSSVVRLVRHDRNLTMSQEKRSFFKGFVKKAFAHRRKQLGSIFKDMIKSTSRAEELSNADWVALVNDLAEQAN